MKDENVFKCPHCGRLLILVSKLNLEIDTVDKDLEEDIKNLIRNVENTSLDEAYMIEKIRNGDLENER